jgi:anhydro-N-acetylmuramic acid kinase
MQKLKEHDFVKRPVPRSAWRLDFGSSYADRILADYSHLSKADMLATMTEFAAYAITRSITDNVKTIAEIKVIMASGGGTRNSFLNNIPAASGAVKFGILGKLVQPPRLAKA